MSDSSVTPPENPSLAFPDDNGHLAAIPTLTHEVNVAAQAAEGSAASRQRQPDASPTSAQPQQSAGETTPAEIKNNNPFLPPHIRQRLDSGRQQALVEELSQLGESLERSRQRITTESGAVTHPAEGGGQGPTLTQADLEHLIDEMVESYLPKIAKALKKRLRAQLHLDDPAT